MNSLRALITGAVGAWASQKGAFVLVALGVGGGMADEPDL
jgi:hypothetical protein